MGGPGTSPYIGQLRPDDSPEMGFEGLGFGAKGLGFRGLGLGFLRFRVWGLGFGV